MKRSLLLDVLPSELVLQLLARQCSKSRPSCINPFACESIIAIVREDIESECE